MHLNFLKTGIITLFLTTLLVQNSGAEDFKKADIVVQSPWTRATPLTAKVAGGYVVIQNNGDTEDRLISVTSPGLDRIELHEMSMENQVMRMRKLKSPIIIPAKGQVELKPGGYHVMFLNLKNPFKQGETVPATLHFEKAGDIDVRFSVEGMGAKSAHDKNADQKPAKTNEMDHKMHNDVH